MDIFFYWEELEELFRIFKIKNKIYLEVLESYRGSKDLWVMSRNK